MVAEPNPFISCSETATRIRYIHVAVADEQSELAYDFPCVLRTRVLS